MSNYMNLQFCITLILLNQWMTSLVFFDWLYISWGNKFLLIFSKIILLFFQFYFLIGWLGDMIGLIESCLYGVSVWHRQVSVQSFPIRSLDLIFVAICFASRLIDICNLGDALYVLVAFSPKSNLCCSVDIFLMLLVLLAKKKTFLDTSSLAVSGWIYQIAWVEWISWVAWVRRFVRGVGQILTWHDSMRIHKILVSVEILAWRPGFRLWRGWRGWCRSIKLWRGSKFSHGWRGWCDVWCWIIRYNLK